MDVAQIGSDRGIAGTQTGLLASLGRRVGGGDLITLAGPIFFFVAAIALLTYDHVQGHVSETFFWSALLLVITIFVWLVGRVGDGLAGDAGERRDPLYDDATGLGSRQKLLLDLNSTDSAPRLLLMVEPQRPPAAGRLAADDSPERLRQRLGKRLADAASLLNGSAYLLDGERLALVLPASDREPGELIAQATSALSLGTASLKAAYGEVRLPEEADGAEAALRIAAHRLALRQSHQIDSPRRQAYSSLVAVLDARRPDLRSHRREVVPYAIAVGRRMGLQRDELDDLVLAAALQDIGLLTVPEAILEKSAPLSEPEQALIREHPRAGERIIAAAPALASVARLVRSAYERFDGCGYPDGLCGEEIPPGARILAVCVAAAAMRATRKHQAARSLDAVIDELERCSGSQFDPDAVNALVAELRADSAPAEVGGRAAPTAPANA